MKTKHRKARPLTVWATVDAEGRIDWANIQARKADLYYDRSEGERPTRVKILEVLNQ